MCQNAAIDVEDPFSGEQIATGSNILLKADFILRISDAVDFHVHRDILRAVSGFFEGLFAFPGGDSSPKHLVKEGRPVLILEDTVSGALRRVLSLAYPTQSLAQYTPKTEDLHIMKKCSRARFFDTNPHRDYPIALLWGLGEVARKAALATLKFTFLPVVPDFPEMQILPWVTANKLLRFHRTCAMASQELVRLNLHCPGIVVSVLSSHFAFTVPFFDAGKPVAAGVNRIFAWWKSAEGHSEECVPSANAASQGSVHFMIAPGTGVRLFQRAVPWFQTHLRRVSDRLLGVTPCPGVGFGVMLRNASPELRKIIDACPTCVRSANADLVTFSQQLQSNIPESNRMIGVFLLGLHYLDLTDEA
ncbi:hypothetical protein FB45DRAFT_1038077 [Roridomyces roridus]|uniref:BTB domain-containing protein n=1 Tax=Roridomyces roridus TaxID=1738132 RepID=A0AAD7B5C4_9AGAR|nr:hypothetical protein FB45DRAFT_1038077 [Roridomyces roridus]